jgi:pimeloyl-ACP methyl ester carboxylesterase
LHYRDWGDPAAPALILLHGATVQARVWDPFAEAMADRYRVLALDLRGHGESDWAEDYGVERVLSDLESFVKALGLDEFACVGNSNGGRLGCVYAARHPDQVTRLSILEGFMGGAVIPAAVTMMEQIWGLPDAFSHLDEALAAYRRIAPRAEDGALRLWVGQSLKQGSDGHLVWRIDPVLRKPGPPGRLNPPRIPLSRSWRTSRVPHCWCAARRASRLSGCT